jgi:hypothetical protein
VASTRRGGGAGTEGQRGASALAWTSKLEYIDQVLCRRQSPLLTAIIASLPTSTSGSRSHISVPQPPIWSRSSPSSSAPPAPWPSPSPRPRPRPRARHSPLARAPPAAPAPTTATTTRTGPTAAAPSTTPTTPRAPTPSRGPTAATLSAARAGMFLPPPFSASSPALTPPQEPRLSPHHQLLRHLQPVRQQLPVGLRLDHLPAHRVLHR